MDNSFEKTIALTLSSVRPQNWEVRCLLHHCGVFMSKLTTDQ